MEKPDVILIFTDPRFFIWLWEMEDEIHDVCPIAYWHVWDNYPLPEFNKVLYESTDLINCHSHLTYEMVSTWYPKKTNFIPHSLPNELFYPLPKNEIQKHRVNLIGKERKDHFVLFWVNRNARRKRPNDVLLAWAEFMKTLNEKHQRSDATLLMHTDPHDNEGPNLIAAADMLGIKDSVVFSNARVEFDQMNILHNITDACINISYAEGFGLATLEAMQCGNPIIAAKTGGLTRQVVDHRDGTENGVALDIDFKSLVGSQQVPFIYEDYCATDKVANAILKLYEMPDKEKVDLSDKVKNYIMSEFNHQDTIDSWHETLLDLVEKWQKNKPKQWNIQELNLR
jgi:glycosyltransferase involved in cell wall biosynthesis